MVPHSLCNKLTVIFAIVGLSFEFILGTCIERDEQIQKYLTSSKPPFDNYFNISKAVYPSVDLPSLLINISVVFLETAGEKSNGSNSLSTLKRNVSRSTLHFTWSTSCLYVSVGEISLESMKWFSLGAIFPNRRKRELHITLPELCRDSPVDINKTMEYFLSTDIAVNPLVFDPSRNTVECIIPGHEKAPPLPGLKKLLHTLCWSLLYISLVMGTFTSQWVIKKLREWDKEESWKNERSWKKIAAMMISSVFLFFGSLAIFMACHHLLWILLGVITEPFWGFTILVAVISVCTIFFFLTSELFDVLPAPQNSDPTRHDQPSGDQKIVFIMSLIRSFAVLSAFVLLLLVLFAVAQVFLSESLVATLVQNALTFFVTAWLGYLGLKKEIITGDLKIKRSENNGNNGVRTEEGISLSVQGDAGPST
nr:uncharacterized protein LOC131770555 [Pocillopora verrucosa]